MIPSLNEKLKTYLNEMNVESKTKEKFLNLTVSNTFDREQPNSKKYILYPRASTKHYEHDIEEYS